jgi:ketosteroid isomerase-like protein
MRKPNKLHPLALMASAALLLSAPAQVSGQSAENTIRESYQKYVSALENGDTATALKLFTKNAEVVSPMQTEMIKGKDAVVKNFNRFSDFIRSEKLKIELRVDGIETHGNTAHALGTYKKVRPDGTTFKGGRIISIWKREAGNWKIHRHLWQED